MGQDRADRLVQTFSPKAAKKPGASATAASCLLDFLATAVGADGPSAQPAWLPNFWTVNKQPSLWTASAPVPKKDAPFCCPSVSTFPDFLTVVAMNLELPQDEQGQPSLPGSYMLLGPKRDRDGILCLAAGTWAVADGSLDCLYAAAEPIDDMSHFCPSLPASCQPTQTHTCIPAFSSLEGQLRRGM